MGNQLLLSLNLPDNVSKNMIGDLVGLPDSAPLNGSYNDDAMSTKMHWVWASAKLS